MNSSSEESQIVLSVDNIGSFEGLAKNNKLSGKFIIKCFDSRIIEGEFQENELHGILKLQVPTIE